MTMQELPVHDTRHKSKVINFMYFIPLVALYYTLLVSEEELF